MRSVGPFILTESEFAAMEILWREDERQLKSTGLRAARLGGQLIVKSGDELAVPAVKLINSRVLVDSQSDFGWGNGAGLDTGESGETAEVEAESEIIRISLGS